MQGAAREELRPQIDEEVLRKVAEIAGRRKGRPDMINPVQHEVQ